MLARRILEVPLPESVALNDVDLGARGRDLETESLRRHGVGPGEDVLISSRFPDEDLDQGDEG